MNHMSQENPYSPQERFRLVKFVKDYLERNGGSVAKACQAVGISATSYRRWRDRLAQHPEYLENEAIEEGDRRPKQFARQTSACTRQKVINEAKKPQHGSANSITQALNSDGVKISVGKVIELLEEEGLYGMIQVKQSDGTYRRKRGLLRLCEQRQ